MEALLGLLGLLVLVAVLVLPIWTLVNVLSLKRSREEMQRELGALREELRHLRASLGGVAPVEPPRQKPVEVPAAAQEEPLTLAAALAVSSPRPPPLPVMNAPAPVTKVPELPLVVPETVRAAEPVAPGVAELAAAKAGGHWPAEPALPKTGGPTVARPVPPVPPGPTVTRVPPPVTAPERPVISWEQFAGAKLFAWIGGFALFLGFAFFIKYSFEHDLVPPALRATLSALAGVVLVAGGLWLPRERYHVAAQTLCATGVVILYAVIFACRAVYHFPAFSEGLTFGLMVVVTAGAFLLAVRMDARVVAVLGMLGGFLTPVILPGGGGSLLTISGYCAALGAGVAAVALWQGRAWHFLLPMAAGGTITLGAWWAVNHANAGNFRAYVAACAGFSALYLGVVALARGRGGITKEAAGASAMVAFAGMLVAWCCLGGDASAVAAEQPGTLLVLMGLSSAALLALVWMHPPAARLQSVAAGVAWAWLAVWTSNWVSDAMLSWMLGGYLGFALLYTAFPLWLRSRRPEVAAGPELGWFAPAALLLVLLPIFKMSAPPALVWLGVLLLVAVAIGLAVVTGGVLPVLAALLITVGAALAWLLRLPAAVEGASRDDLGFFLLIIGGFCLLFAGAALFLRKRFAPAVTDGPRSLEDEARAQLPVLSLLLPFALLVMATLRLTPPDPHRVLGLALVLSGLALALANFLRLPWLPAAALAGAGAVQWAWIERVGAGMPTGDSVLPINLWIGGFLALFAAFPFLFRERWRDGSTVWATAALAGPVQFFLMYRLSGRWISDDYLGLLPLAFAVPFIVGTWQRARELPPEHPGRNTQLAWWGGVALFFITLIFPLHFSRQWITLGWALEGAALLWWMQRVPHPGLRVAGVGLLAMAFARLALNPAVLSYYPRGNVRVFNWILYTYGIVAACCFLGAHLLKPPQDRIGEFRLRGWLGAGGVILLFLLLNLEIADWFARGDSTRMLEFSGNFARDLAYTIGWASFALGLVIAGIIRRERAVRIAGLALLGVTLLKLFLHDTVALGQLYRIGAFMAVAVIAMAASFLYQRFVPDDDHSKRQ